MASRSYTLNFVGDVMLGRLIDQLFPEHVHEPSEADIVRSFKGRNAILANYDSDSPWSDTLPLFHEADLNIINLETAVTTHAVKWPDKVFNYRMHPANLSALTAAHISYAGLANNHTLDFSEQGLSDTLQGLREAGIATAGAGASDLEAMQPAVLTLPASPASPTSQSPHLIYIWAASDHPRDWQDVAGFHFLDYSPQSKARLQDLISRTAPPPPPDATATDVALKVVSLHWGPNYAWRPSAEIQALARFLVDECGVDVVHGHSAHHVQGVEVRAAGVIVYGCGDFVDDYALVPDFRNDLGAVWRVVVEEEVGEGVVHRLRVRRLEMWPTKIEQFRARRLRPEEADSRWVREKVRDLSAELGTKATIEEGGEGRLIVEVA